MFIAVPGRLLLAFEEGERGLYIAAGDAMDEEGGGGGGGGGV